MKMKHKHNVSRLLSLLLVVAALAGLLSVGAMAAERSVTLNIKNIVKTGGNITAELYLESDETLTTENGVTAFTLFLVVPEGLTLTKIDTSNSTLGDSVFSAEGGNSTFFITTNYDEDTQTINAWTGGYIATLSFSVDSGASGKKTIGFTGDSVVYYGTGEENYTFGIEVKCEEIDLSASVTPEPEAGLLGDANGDGVVNAKDATLIAKYAAGIIEAGSVKRVDLTDCNDDGVVNAKDATLVAKYAAGMAVNYPVGSPIE